MTTYTLTANATLRDIGNAGIWGVATVRTGGDTIDTNGFVFTQDQDSRYGLSGNTSASWGNLTINANKGGEIVFDARYVRLIPYNTGSGTITLGSLITCGSATGYVIGLYSAITTAPVNTGVTAGFIKVTAWNGTAFPTSGSYTQAGFTFTITGADTAGWIEVVADEGASAAFTMNRLGTVRAKGAWYEFAGATTTGTRTTAYQLPTNGSLMHCPGVMVQSANATITAASWSGGIATVTTSAAHGFNIREEVTIAGSTPSGYNVADIAITAITSTTFSYPVAVDPGTWTSGGTAYIYQFYPNAGTRPALIANIQTDIVRGRWCWITTAGLVYFGYDGTNQTGGYIVPSGRKLRVANIFTTHCTTAARTANVAPNVVAATRFEFVTSGGGVIDFNKVNMAWYMNMAQAYSISLTDTFTFETLIATECAQPITWHNVGIGQNVTGFTATTAALVQFGLNFAGGTLRNCTWTRLAQAGATTQVVSWVDCVNFTVTNQRTYSLTKAGNASSGSAILTRVIDSSFTNLVNGAGLTTIVGCDNVSWTNTTYFDNINGTTVVATIPMYLWSLATAASYSLKFDGVDFGGQTLVQPASGILNISVAGCNDIKLRNIGTAAVPLDMGGAQVDGTFTQATTTVTVTTLSAHGLKTGDIIYLLRTVAGTNTFTVGSKTLASAPTPTTFTVTSGTGTDATVRNCTYYPTMAAVLVNFLASGAANGVKIQRCYAPHLRTGIISTQDNSANNILMESVQGADPLALLVPMLNTALKMVWATPALTRQTSCYGTHFFDYFTTGIPTNTAAQSWASSGTTSTVTSTAHNLRTGDQIVVTVSSNTAVIVLGVKSITATGPNTFTFTSISATSSGTITYVPINGRVAIEMNETTSSTSSQVTLANGAAFTSTGALYMPTIGHQADWTAPYNILGHASFPIAEAVMLTGTIANYDISYSLDNGVTYYNLYYPRPGGGGSNASTNVTMTSTTGVAAGDYVWGTNIAPNAKVVSITNGTTVVVDTANIGAVSGVLRFNHLPSSTVADPLVGFPLRVRVKTTTTNTASFDALSFYTTSTTSSRTATFPLDTVPVTITVKDAGTLAAIPNARVRITTDVGGFVVLSGVTNASGVLTGTTEYASNDISGTVRRASPGDGTLYKPGSISGTTSSAGFASTILLIADE